MSLNKFVECLLQGTDKGT